MKDINETAGKAWNQQRNKLAIKLRMKTHLKLRLKITWKRTEIAFCQI